MLAPAPPHRAALPAIKLRAASRKRCAVHLVRLPARWRSALLLPFGFPKPL